MGKIQGERRKDDLQIGLWVKRKGQKKSKYLKVHKIDSRERRYLVLMR